MTTTVKTINCTTCDSKYVVSYKDEEINTDGNLVCVFCGSDLNNNSEQEYHTDEDSLDSHKKYEYEEELDSCWTSDCDDFERF